MYPKHHTYVDSPSQSKGLKGRRQQRRPRTAMPSHYGRPPSPHGSIDSLGPSTSRCGWLSRPPFAAARRGYCPLMVGRFWVRLFCRASRHTINTTKMATDISAGLPNIGQRLSPLSPRRALSPTHATIARCAWIRRRHPEQRGGDVRSSHVGRLFWILTIRTTRPLTSSLTTTFP